MMKLKLPVLAATLGLSIVGCLRATTVTIDGKSEIFSAGQLAPPDSMGLLAPVFGFTSGAGQTLTFNSVTGLVSCGGMCTNVGANGGTNQGGASTGTNLGLTGSGLSQIQFNGMEFFLVAVFLDNITPSGAGPASIGTYGAGGTISATAASYSPLIDQVFYVGTGNNNGQQIYNIPTTATRVFFGFADGVPLFNGQAGAYGDNTGFLTANFQINTAPEPSTVVLLALGLAGLAFARKRQLV